MIFFHTLLKNIIVGMRKSGNSKSWFASNLSGLDVHRFSQDKG